MRAVASLLSLVAALTVAAPVARAVERPPDAQMLLDLDLLREADPRAHREVPVARSVRLLEFLKRLEAPATARPKADTRRSPKDAC